MKKVMTIREFESWLSEMDNHLEAANKKGVPLIVEEVEAIQFLKSKGYTVTKVEAN
jgi:hypothetical protein